MEQIISKLKAEPKFRERRNKNIGIAELLIYKYHLKADAKLVEDVICEAMKLDRYWRKATSENEDLRGEDYKTKDEVEQRYEMSIGYEAGFNQKLKI